MNTTHSAEGIHIDPFEHALFGGYYTPGIDAGWVI